MERDYVTGPSGSISGFASGASWTNATATDQLKPAAARGAVTSVCAAEYLRASNPGVPLRHHPAMRAAVGIGTQNALLDAFLRPPHPLLVSCVGGPFENVIAWACAKLVSAMRDESDVVSIEIDSGNRLFGEFPPDTLPHKIRIRLAQDASNLSGDRDIHPAANGIFAWDVLSFLVSDVPRSIVVGYADTRFDILDYLYLGLGALVIDPTFSDLGCISRRHGVARETSESVQRRDLVPPTGV
jgi:hypothetical protein